MKVLSPTQTSPHGEKHKLDQTQNRINNDNNNRDHLQSYIDPNLSLAPQSSLDSMNTYNSNNTNEYNSNDNRILKPQLTPNVAPYVCTVCVYCMCVI